MATAHTRGLPDAPMNATGRGESIVAVNCTCTDVSADIAGPVRQTAKALSVLPVAIRILLPCGPQTELFKGDRYRNVQVE